LYSRALAWSGRRGGATVAWRSNELLVLENLAPNEPPHGFDVRRSNEPPLGLSRNGSVSCKRALVIEGAGAQRLVSRSPDLPNQCEPNPVGAGRVLFSYDCSGGGSTLHRFRLARGTRLLADPRRLVDR
jgi:hypothetical protein